MVRGPQRSFDPRGALSPKFAHISWDPPSWIRCAETQHIDMTTHHVRLGGEDALCERLRRHPLDRQGALLVLHAVVVCPIHIT